MKFFETLTSPLFSL